MYKLHSSCFCRIGEPYINTYVDIYNIDIDLLKCTDLQSNENTEYKIK